MDVPRVKYHRCHFKLARAKFPHVNVLVSRLTKSKNVTLDRFTVVVVSPNIPFRRERFMGSVRQLTVATGMLLALTSGMLTMFLFSMGSSGELEQSAEKLSQPDNGHAIQKAVTTTTVTLTVTQTLQPFVSTAPESAPPAIELQNTARLSPNPHVRPCRRCKYQIDYEPSLNESLFLNTTGGWGRTGNVVMALRMAMGRAHACKTFLILPSQDDSREHVLSFHPELRFFDFRNRPGPPAHPDCNSTEVARGMVTMPSQIWFLPDLPSVTPEQKAFHDAYVQEYEEISACLRWFTGMCDDNTCARVGDLSSTLVMHFRMGDVFSHDFRVTKKWYGQPPFSYYLAAMAHRNWDRVYIMGGEDFLNYNPAWVAIYRMYQNQLTRMPLILQNNDWETDFPIMLCARYVVESHTTFSTIWDIGYAEEVYTWRACERLQANTSAGGLPRQYHRITQSEPYNWYYDHQNSREEYLEILMAGSNVPTKCPVHQEPCCKGQLTHVLFRE